MDAHRIEVFDRADDHAVVSAVAHDLHLEFLPAEERFLDQNLAHRREVEATAADFIEFLAVVGDAATRAAQSESGADDEREGANLRPNLTGFLERVGHAGPGAIEPDLEHDIFEDQAVLAALDGLGVGPDETGAMTLQRAIFDKRHRGVECSLTAECRKNGVGLFALEDFFDRLGRDRLDIGPHRELRIGHDRRGV